MTVREAAWRYVEMGWQVVPIPLREKRPVLKDWPNLRLTPFDLDDAFRGPSNIGIILGAPSGGLVDVDLDCMEAVELAPFVLPSTWTYGRASKPRSHWLYMVAGGMEPRRYQDPLASSPVTMLERRSTMESGRGLQSVVPPSTHPSGEAVQWSDDADGTNCPRTMAADELAERVERLAVATLYARHGHAAEARAWLAGGKTPQVPVRLLLEANRLRGIVPTRERIKVVVREANREKAASIDAAVREYNAAHRYEWPRSNGQCPICGHRECFGSFRDVDRWVCHSASHTGIGVPGEGCHTGDALDLDAHRAGVTRIELLKREGYL